MMYDVEQTRTAVTDFRRSLFTRAVLPLKDHDLKTFLSIESPQVFAKVFIVPSCCAALQCIKRNTIRVENNPALRK